MFEDIEMRCGNVLDVLKGMESESVHCVVTSPPYYKMRSYDGSQEVEWPDGMICPLGLEPSPEAFVAHLTMIFREMRKVLRDDGIFWLNIMDGYAGSGKAGKGGKQVWGGIESGNQDRMYGSPTRGIEGVKDLDLLGVPWKLALSLRNDGWYLRGSQIWAKSVSFCDDYVGSCMPESVSGTRWERHKIKAESLRTSEQSHSKGVGDGRRDNSGGLGETHSAKWKPCPGCEKCRENGGYVLREGSWRPTRSHEYLFMFTKTKNYFADQYGILEEAVNERGTRAARGGIERSKEPGVNSRPAEYAVYSGQRNPRSVWTFDPARFGGSHFAVFPEEMIKPMIRVSTSKRTCGKCGKPWARIVDKETYRDHASIRDMKKTPLNVVRAGWRNGGPKTKLMGYAPICNHNDGSGKAVILDPFMGRGTTLFVARKLGHRGVGVDLSEKYLKMAREWIEKRMREEKVLENENLSKVFT